MRILLFTGKGGVGKTSIAAATALSAARAGVSTLIMSTDPAHSLADSFDREVDSEPTSIEEGLWAQQIDSQQRLEENWQEIQRYAVDVLSWTGMDGIQAEELSVIPGLDELFSLADIKRYHDDSSYDLLVVDCAPTAETLRLLSLPEIMAWYIEKIFPIERKIVNAVRPVLSRMKSLPPIANDNVFAAIERFYRRIEGIREILTDAKTSSIRLVVNAEKMVIAEARRTFTYLSLFGYRVDAVIVNRLIPDRVTDEYFDHWKQIQQEHLATIEESFSPVPILTARLFEQEMVGTRLLGQLAEEVYGTADPTSVMYSDEPFRVTTDNGSTLLWIKLPFVGKGDVDLSRSGDELYIKVGNFKRNLVLPMSLQRAQVKGAGFDGDRLRISFEVT
ncbi:MAG: TRC40/GET3/ArsA family transport-energizing ATPase [Actinobacteria bacterium]|nr:TRC40/GET3/ArsA family transport-energizing ATPase [Actinomycetota bacterium]